MREYVINRPNGMALRGILNENRYNAVGTILRLAWQAGLTRNEIAGLTWDQVDFGNGQLLLKDRSVPMEEELHAWLLELREQRGGEKGWVCLSDWNQERLKPSSISRLARGALEKKGQYGIRLMDLRHDYILNQLAEKPWQHVSRISGNKPGTLICHYNPLLEQNIFERAKQEKSTPQINELHLWELLQMEKQTPGGKTLWLIWQAGMQLNEVVSLRWESVDLDGGVLTLSDRIIPLREGILQMLREDRARDPQAVYVVTTPRTKRPYCAVRLSRLSRRLLVQGGMDGLSLRELRRGFEIGQEKEERLLVYLQKHRSITCRQAETLLGMTGTAVYSWLQRLARQEKLIHVGTRYYLPGEVIPPEQHAAAIEGYLRQEGFAYRADIARLLGIEPCQCGPILKRMIAAGRIVQERQRYALK